MRLFGLDASGIVNEQCTDANDAGPRPRAWIECLSKLAIQIQQGVLLLPRFGVSISITYSFGTWSTRGKSWRNFATIAMRLALIARSTAPRHPIAPVRRFVTPLPGLLSTLGSTIVAASFRARSPHDQQFATNTVAALAGIT